MFYLQNRINTGATEREKRLKRREETNLLSVRLNGIGLGLSFLASREKREIVRIAWVL